MVRLIAFAALLLATPVWGANVFDVYESKGPEAAMKMVEKDHSLVKAKDGAGRTILMRLAMDFRVSYAMRVITLGGDAGAVDEDGNNCLHLIPLSVDWGTRPGRDWQKLVGELVKSGCDLGKKNKRGITPLNYASSIRKEMGCEYKDLGAKPSAADLVYLGHYLAFVRMCRQNPAILKQRFPIAANGLVLHVAAKTGQVKIARYVLEHAAAVNETDDTGSTAKDLAEQLGDGPVKNKLLDLLRQHGGKRSSTK